MMLTLRTMFRTVLIPFRLSLFLSFWRQFFNWWLGSFNWSYFDFIRKLRIITVTIILLILVTWILRWLLLIFSCRWSSLLISYVKMSKIDTLSCLSGCFDDFAFLSSSSAKLWVEVTTHSRNWHLVRWFSRVHRWMRFVTSFFLIPFLLSWMVEPGVTSTLNLMI